MRGLMALGAAGLAAVASVVSSQGDDADLVPFFIGLTMLGAIAAWGVAAARPRVLDAVLVVWAVAAIWVAVLLIGFAGAASSPPPGPVATYFGVPAMAYHLLGLYGGLGLLLIERWRSTSTADVG